MCRYYAATDPVAKGPLFSKADVLNDENQPFLGSAFGQKRPFKTIEKGASAATRSAADSNKGAMSAVLDFEMCKILPGWVLWSSRSQRRSGIQLIRKDINNNDIWLA